jgi:predicted membrane-bound spermidine synthase
MKKFTLELVAFFCGAVVMSFEIVGSRMLGPYVGTSMFAWTSIIGVILLSLSIGYYWGGRIADMRPRADILSLFIFIAGLFLIITVLIKGLILETLTRSIDNIHIVSVIASLILFTVPSVLLGMVSPFAVRIKMKSVEKSGSTVGNLYSISTIGSIVGVFLTGFYLIPNYKISHIIMVLAIILFATALFLNGVYRFINQKN